MGCTTSNQAKNVANTISVEPAGNSVQRVRSRSLDNETTPNPTTGGLKLPAVIRPSGSQSQLPVLAKSSLASTVVYDEKGFKETASSNKMAPRLPKIGSYKNIQEEAEKLQRGKASAASIVSNISTASKGISYDFRVPGDAAAKATLPDELQRRLRLTADTRLTMERLKQKQREVMERKQKLMQGRKSQAETFGRPKTALAREKREEVRLKTAAGRRPALPQDTQEKHQRRSERAMKNRERAPELQDPEFVQKLETFGEEGNIEVPLSPIHLLPKLNNGIPTSPFSPSVPSLSNVKHIGKDDFFD